jgi:hypothetical protein
MKLPIDEEARPAKRQRREEESLRAFLNEGFSDDSNEDETRDEYDDWIKNNPYREKKVFNPI